MKLLELTDPLKLRREFGFFDDFEWLITAHRWATLVADGGSVAVGDEAGGVVTITTGGTDNNEAGFKTAAEIFLFAADKPILFETRIKWSEANTDDANVLVGFMSAAGADAILDNGGGPAASYSGAVFFKVDGGTTWNFETSLAGVQTTTALPDYPAGGTTYQTLRIEAREQGSVIEIVPWIDGLQCKDANGRPVKHLITLGSPTEMNACAYAKAGGANAEVVKIDYAAAYALR